MPLTHLSPLITIAVADDHVFLREALCKEIDTWENCKVILHVSDGKDLIDLLPLDHLPSLVLLDLNMPKMNGYETLEYLHNAHTALPILVMSQYESIEMVWKIIHLGAKAFVSKSSGLPQLQKAIRATLKTGSYFADATATRFIRKATQAGKVPLENQLTALQFLFLQHCCSHESYKQIAEAMHLTIRQIEYLRETLFEAFEVKSRTSLVMTALGKGLVFCHGTKENHPVYSNN